MPNEIDDGCPMDTECIDGCCAPVCGGHPMCEINEIEELCPDGYLCEGECCVPSCVDDG
jgi:hypothetical protein